MNILIGLAILSVFASMVLVMLYDLDTLIQEAEHQERLDALWGDD